MGREHAAAVLSAGDRITAFLDADLGAAESAARDYGGVAARATSDLGRGLERFVGVGASALVVASPSALHLPHAEAALSFGLPVLIEKPPWIPSQSPLPLLRASRGGALVAVGMTTRFNPGVRAIREAVRAGVLGELLVASDRVAFTIAPGDLGDWYFDAHQSGGGVLVTNGVHSLDRLRWILGQELSLRRARLTSDMLSSCEDTAVLECSAGDTTVSVVELWGPGPLPPSELLVLGTRGCCWSDASGRWRLSSVDGSSSGGRPEGWSETVAQWRAFRALVLDGLRDGALASIEDLLASMSLLEEAMQR